MYFTPYKRYDGYRESLCSLRTGLGPILKCRVVSTSTKDYEVVVRDYSTGEMVSARRTGMTIIEAKEMAIRDAFSFVKREAVIDHENMRKITQNT